MKRQHILPAGCHDGDSAAAVLTKELGRKVTKHELLARMREIGWLYVGGDNHNLPRHELKHRGALTTQERGYNLKGKREIGKTYSVMLLTQTGFQEIKKIMNEKRETLNTKKVAPELKIIKLQNQNIIAQKNETQDRPFVQETADQERRKLLQQMNDWNLPIAAGRN